MTEQLTGYEASSVAEIGAILDAMPADADAVYLERIGYSERAIAAVAAKRAGGVGSTPSVVLRGPHTVNFDTPDALGAPGAPFLALEVGQWLMEAWVQVTALFQGHRSRHSANSARAVTATTTTTCSASTTPASSGLRDAVTFPTSTEEKAP